LKNPAEQKHIAGVTGSHSDWGTDRGMHVPADVPPMANTTAPDYAKKLELQKFTGAARSALPSRRMSDPVSSVTH